MQDREVINILQNQLHFSSKTIPKIRIFVDELLKANKKYNFISKSTENNIWSRHILDSAQLVKFIDFSKCSLSDLGSGAGFPGLILALFNNNKDFHVKLYEKSPVKRAFLVDVCNKLSIKVQIYGNIYQCKGINTHIHKTLAACMCIYKYSQEWEVDQLLQFCRCNFFF